MHSSCMHSMHAYDTVIQIIDVYSIKACEVKASAPPPGGVAAGEVGIVLIVL